MKRVVFLIVLSFTFIYVSAQDKKQTDDSRRLKKSMIVTGSLVEHQNLPVAIKEDLKSKYPDYKFEKAIKQNFKGKENYEVSLYKNEENIILIYDMNGNFIKKQNVKNLLTPNLKK